MPLSDQTLLVWQLLSRDYLRLSYVGCSYPWKTWLLSPEAEWVAHASQPELDFDADGDPIEVSLFAICIGQVLERCFPEIDNFQLFRLHYDADLRAAPELGFGVELAQWQAALPDGRPVYRRLGFEALSGNNYTHAGALVEAFRKRDWSSYLFQPQQDCRLPFDRIDFQQMTHPGIITGPVDALDLEIREAEQSLRPNGSPALRIQ